MCEEEKFHKLRTQLWRHKSYTYTHKHTMYDGNPHNMNKNSTGAIFFVSIQSVVVFVCVRIVATKALTFANEKLHWARMTYLMCRDGYNITKLRYCLSFFLCFLLVHRENSNNNLAAYQRKREKETLWQWLVPKCIMCFVI